MFCIRDNNFELDGRDFSIRCGELHFTRIPTAYWRHRLEMCRAMGLNTVCAYLFWNAHEPLPGQFNFTGELDAAKFCRTALEVGLKVILRPGPYACAEWDLGGLPWWLLKYDDIELRSRDPRFLDASRRYLEQVGMHLAPLQCHLGGPIIMAQVENEYGSYGTDREYVGAIRDMLLEAGFSVPLFTCDGPTQMPNATRRDIFSVVNFPDDPAGAFARLRAVQPNGPLMCGEYYPGWFDVWGKPHHRGETSKLIQDVGWMLTNKASFSIYMVHGGTSFGFTAGANREPFRPQTTSYDYDAPISEQGVATEKFHALRDLFRARVPECQSLPAVPVANPVVSFGSVHLPQVAPMLAQLPDAVVGEDPLSFEKLDQPHGCALYRTRVPAGEACIARFAQVNDLSLVYLNGKQIGILDRRLQQNDVELPAREDDQDLDVLVYAFGRVNYGPHLHDRKGIIGKVELVVRDQTLQLQHYHHFKFCLDPEHLANLQFHTGKPFGPCFYRGEFDLPESGDTFLDMQNWGCGVVWINGHNLGRFWKLGPTQTLYVPAPFMKATANQIVVWDLFPNNSPCIISVKQPILDSLASCERDAHISGVQRCHINRDGENDL